MNQGFHKYSFQKYNGGAALFISLMFLIILTLIGISAANVGIMQERMAGNVRETNEAFQNAEGTLRFIEKELGDVVGGGGGSVDLGVIKTWAQVQDELGIERNDCTLSGADVESWPWGDQGVVIALTDAGTGGTIFGSACRPMNELNDTSLDEYYLVAARATGPAGVGEVIVQTIFFWPE